MVFPVVDMRKMVVREVLAAAGTGGRMLSAGLLGGRLVGGSSSGRGEG